ncbi:hypothetical protein RMATCC62417_00108 [Rhizopus microsporus]|nr:hypothetical protein RMATCC62417_00108 [Rhizopus microsporus]
MELMEVLVSYIGLCDIFVMVDGSSEDVNNKKTMKERSVRFANNEYKVCSGFDWSKQVELNNRAAAGMQAVYDEIPSLDNGDSNTILNYLQVLSKNRKKDTGIVKQKDICTVIGKLQTITCQLVLAKTSSGAPCALAHKTSTQKRQKARRAFKKSNQANQAEMAGKQRLRMVMQAYQERRRGTNDLVYTQRTQRALVKKAVVIPVNEFRTSITCCKCHRKLDQKYEAQTLVCNHRKRRLRLGVEKNAAQHCLDDDCYVICRTSQCPERMPGNFPPAIYQLKQCKLCPAGNGQDIVSTCP